MPESPKVKVGIVCITLNAPYWQYANEMLFGLETFFLKHKDIKDKYETEMMLWSDIPEDEQEISERLAHWLHSRGDMTASIVGNEQVLFDAVKGREQYVSEIIAGVKNARKRGIKIFPTESIEWPMPTLMRYHLFLQQEEYLKKFDYIFYIDVDMKIVDWIGEEIFGTLTAAEHPMYALRKNYHPPLEPNEKSTAFIRRPGKVIEENGKRFKPYYYAGGFQGGKAEEFLKAMKVMKKNIDLDLANNYVAIWNDETHWNKYLFDNPPEVILNPSYIYPDSLIDSYYVKLWGRNYSPKIMTLTKPFTMSSEGAQAVREMLAL